VAQEQGRKGSLQWAEGGEYASTARRSGQSAADWQAKLFDTLVERDPITAFGKGPVQEVLLGRRIELAAANADPSLPSLDVGCGNGHIARHLAERTTGAIVGIDVSSEALRFASERNAHPRVNYLQASVEDFEPDCGFGLITLYEVLEHVDDPVAVLCRLAGWLEPGGRLIFSTPNRSCLNRRIKNAPGIRNAYRRLTKLPADAPHPAHVEEYDYDTLLQMVRRAGLEVENVGGAILLMPFPDAIGPLARSIGFARLNVRSGNWRPRLATDVYLVARKPRLAAGGS